MREEHLARGRRLCDSVHEYTRKRGRRRLRTRSEEDVAKLYAVPPTAPGAEAIIGPARDNLHLARRAVLGFLWRGAPSARLLVREHLRAGDFTEATAAEIYVALLGAFEVRVRPVVRHLSVPHIENVEALLVLALDAADKFVDVLAPIAIIEAARVEVSE